MPDKAQKPSNSKCKIVVVVFLPPDVQLDVYTQKLNYILQRRIHFYKHHDVYSPHGVVRVANLKNKEPCIILRATLR